MHPKPCNNCGVLFMNPDPRNPDLKTCNNCSKKGDNSMSGLQILITVTPEQHVQIEEQCANEGKSFSEYFVGLHKLNTQTSFQCAAEPNLEEIEERKVISKKGKNK